MYYQFYPAAVDTNTKFQNEISALIKEIGDRGKVESRVAEGVPPGQVSAEPQLSAAAPAPAPAPSPPCIPSAALAPAPTTTGSFTPGMSSLVQSVGGSADFVGVILERDTQHQQLMLDREEKLQMQLAGANAEISKLREEAFEEREAQLRGQQAVLLQVRLEALHSAQLLTDVELDAVEDIIADSNDASSNDHVSALLALSAKMPRDRAFARQLVRKFVS